MSTTGSMTTGSAAAHRRRAALAGGLCLALLVAGFGAAGARAADSPPAQTVRARQHFFGAEHVDPQTGRLARNRVVLSWATTSTMAASLGGRVVLLDSYLHKVEDRPNYVPTTVRELVALRPEFIFIGHGHSDHAQNAGVIAVETGAKVVGTPEHCDQVRADAREHAPSAPPITCLAAVSRGSAPGAEVNELTMLRPDVRVTALKHLHSAAEPPDPEHHPNPVLALPDLSPLLMHPPGPDAAHQVAGSFTDPGDEGDSLLYQFRLGDFSLTWHDTVGPLKERAPEVLQTLRDLPPTDVQAGAVLGLNVATNGLRDPAMYVASLRPRVFVPLHHDFLTEYGSADDYQSAFRDEPQVRDVAPEIRWLTDPHDYLRPELLTFATNDARWS